jgi:L-malate glycosyltransferase
LLNLSKPEEWVEVFGLTALEAMSFGIPVIVPPIGGPAEIVRDGKDGYLISCNETDHISEKIIELSNNSELCLRNSYYTRKRSLEFGCESFKKKKLSVICE